tara:strand:- start:2329 stop:2559 length:231 start_codon:yes stop_codon:yes gene_type:complete
LKAKIKKKVKNKNKKDPCEVCDTNLYYNTDFSRRIGLLDEDCNILGWMCPECGSEFTENNELTKLKLEYDGIEGQA